MKNPRLIKLHDEWLLEATIEDMQEKLASGEVSSVDLIHMYLYRIAEYDTDLRSVIEINPDALQIAAALDSREKSSWCKRCFAWRSDFTERQY